VSYARADGPVGTGAASDADAKARLTRKVVLLPRSTEYVPVQTKFQGNGVLSPRHREHDRNGVHVAAGTMYCTAGHTWRVEVTRPCYGCFPMRYFSEYEYEATLTR